MRELDFDHLQLFVRVAELGTLSAVARERDVPVSQMSRSLVRIGKACGARLIHRSTHGLSLTAEGQTLLDYSRQHPKLRVVQACIDHWVGWFGAATPANKVRRA